MQSEEVDKVIKSLETYTCIIDVHSMQGFNEGWRIVGDDTYDKDREGRVVAFVGEYKSGKTFLMEKVIGKDTPHDQILHTPGLGVILPKEIVFEPKEEVKTVSPKPQNFSRRVQTRPTKQEAPKQLEASKMVNFIVLDTEGTDLATPEYRMFDERSRELFLRHIQLEIAEKFVFVSSKFNQKSQWNIQKLINQLNHKPEKKNYK